MPESVPTPLPAHGRLHHYGYVVQDLEAAVEAMRTAFGAGPFLVMRDVPLERVSSQGAPAVFDHSSAFGQCGEVAVELMQVHRCEPAHLDDAFTQTLPRLHHLAYVVPDFEAASKDLERRGLPELVRAGLGEIQFAYHDAPVLGHQVEVHQDCASLTGFFARIREESLGWDGRDPLR